MTISLNPSDWNMKVLNPECKSLLRWFYFLKQCGLSWLRCKLARPKSPLNEALAGTEGWERRKTGQQSVFVTSCRYCRASWTHRGHRRHWDGRDRCGRSNWKMSWDWNTNRLTSLGRTLMSSTWKRQRLLLPVQTREKHIFGLLRP